MVAFNPDNGVTKWHYQWTPHDVWDYDGVNENILYEQDGQKLLAHFDKNGYLFVLDRSNGKFVRAVKFSKATWGDIDSRTGKVTPRIIPTKEGADICPGPAGAKEWSHASYSQRTGLLYAPVIEICATFKRIPQEFREGMAFWGGNATIGHAQTGAVKAFDPATGQEVWSHNTPNPMVASLLTTAGDLVFAGEATGYLDALSAKTGEVLWRFQTGSGMHGNPVTYTVKGKQYIAVPSGWGGWLEGFAPEMYGATRGSALYVFALP